MNPRAEHVELVLLAVVEDRHSMEVIRAISITNSGRPIDYPDTIGSPLSQSLEWYSAESVFEYFSDEICNFLWSGEGRDSNLFIVWYNETDRAPFVDVVAMRPLTDECVGHVADCAVRLSDVRKKERGNTWQ